MQFAEEIYEIDTGFGLGKLMLKKLLDEIKNLGYEQAELTVVGDNERAIRLYKNFGFIEYGRIPNVNKYYDGTLMVLQIKSVDKKNIKFFSPFFTFVLKV